MRNDPNMYEIFVNVHDVSCDTPGIISKRILRHAMSTKCIVQAPVVARWLAGLAMNGLISTVKVE